MATTKQNYHFAVMMSQALEIDFSSRRRAEADKRFALAALLRDRGATLVQIGDWLGRTVASVLHMLRVHSELMALSADYRDFFADVLVVMNDVVNEMEHQEAS